MSDFVAATIALRDKAWLEVESTPQFKTYAALKAAVEAMAPPPEIGVRRAPPSLFAPRAYSVVSDALKAARRVSQADAARLALKRSGRPLSASDLMTAATAEGAVVGGEKPLTNFTSSLSKDDGLYSFRSGGTYFWWLRDAALPEGWNEAESDDFESLIDSASDHANQEGGDGHGSPATT